MNQTVNSEDKPIVHYTTLAHCEVGQVAVVFPVDHPKRSNTQFVRTSEVISYDPESGVFETRNTRYAPLSGPTKQD